VKKKIHLFIGFLIVAFTMLLIFSFNCKKKSTEPEHIPPPGAPERPSDLVATCTSGTYVYLSWTDNSDNETGFKLQRKENSKRWGDIADLLENVVSCMDTAPDYETLYSYRIAAINDSGASYWSNVTQIITQEAPECAVMIEYDFSADKIASPTKEGPRIWMCSNRYGYYRIMDEHRCDVRVKSDEAYTEEFNLSGREAGQIAMRFNQAVMDEKMYLNLGFFAAPKSGQKCVSKHDLFFGFHNPVNESWRDKYCREGHTKRKIHRAIQLFGDRYTVLSNKWYNIKVEIDPERMRYSLWIEGIKLCNNISMDEILFVPSVYEVVNCELKND